MQAEYYMKDKDNKNAPLFDIIFVNQEFFVNYDGLADLLLPYLLTVEDSNSKAVAFFEAADGYIQFDFNDMIDPNNAASPYSATSMQLQKAYNLEERHAFVKDLQSDLDAFMIDTMKDFTTDKVNKEYNSSLKSDMYTYTFNTDDVVDVGLGFVQYILNNFVK